MKNLITLLSLIVMSLVLMGCFDIDTQTSTQTEEEIKQRQEKSYADAAAAPREFRKRLKENCPHFGSILLTTAETIQLGTRVFNAGGVSLTNRIYEGTVYKILYTIKDDCMKLSDALQVGIANAEKKESYHDKAWALREALDLIMGGPPIKPPGG